MGAQFSKAQTETNIVNKSVTNVIMKSSQNCSANITSNQELTFSDIKTRGCNVNFNDISQEADISQNFSCAQESSQSADLQSKLKTELDAQTAAVTKGFTVGMNSSESKTLTNLKNSVVANIDVSSIANCVANIIASQKLEFGKLDIDCRGANDKSLNFKNIKQKITMTQVSKCIQNNPQASKAVADFENKLKISTSAKTEGIDALASLASVLIPCIISVILSVIIYIFFNS